MQFSHVICTQLHEQGVILLGLDKNCAFEEIGVGDAHRIMEEVSGLKAESMEPALRFEFTLVEI